MLSAVSRYGARVLPNTEQIIGDVRKRGELIRGPQIEQFEAAFAARLGARRATTTSFGRMAFYYILKALKLPTGSEIIFPALTFWVMPEMARQAGLIPVFADVDPTTFTLDPRSFERAITDRTRAVVPTHLYGLSCEMDAVLGIARRYGLAVVEDCAHALGATYRGRPLGTLGDASIFSFQTLKPLNTYGGGMAVARDGALGTRVAEMAAAEPWPDQARVMKKLRLGKLQRVFIRPRVFSVSLFPVLWASSWFQATPDVYLWEQIRSLNPLPDGYEERYSNVQAALGLAALKLLDTWTADTQRHAHKMNEMLAGIPGVSVPHVPADRNHVYYQYCVYAPDRAEVMRRCIRQGVDIETLHVDVCTRLELFGARPGGGSGNAASATPGAERAAEALQMPVYATLTDDQVEVVGQRVRRVLEQWSPGRAADASRAPSA
jgi:dTDP-4-amino-4,6-dideoxygalactose transaminase